MCRQSVAAEIKFDTSLDRGIDGDFIRRVCESYHVEYVPEILVDYYVEHGNNRITSNDRDSLMDAIEGHKSKLAKFDNKLKQHPEKAAIIHQKIAHRYAQCGHLIQRHRFTPRTISELSRRLPLTCQYVNAGDKGNRQGWSL